MNWTFWRLFTRSLRRAIPSSFPSRAMKRRSACGSIPRTFRINRIRLEAIMLMLAKIGLGISGTIAVAAGYTVHEGMVRVSVDEHRANGDHVHLVVPAALIPMAMKLAP